MIIKKEPFIFNWIFYIFYCFLLSNEYIFVHNFQLKENTNLLFESIILEFNEIPEIKPFEV